MSVKWHVEPTTTPLGSHNDKAFKQTGELASGVREIVQGPIDQALANCQDVVDVCFRFESINGNGPNEYLNQGSIDSWLTQLTMPITPRHRQCVPIVDESVLDCFDPLRVLHVEDNLKIGIKGRHDQFDADEDENGIPNEESQKNIFLYLFRILALSMPTKGRGGSWGFGKLATYLMSKFRTAFHVSTYEDEDGKIRRFALGQAHWKNRKLTPTREWRDAGKPIGADGRINYSPVIWFGKKELHTKGDPKTWMPLDSDEEIDALCKSFQIDRPLTKMGTSIMIPCPHDHITGNSIAQAILANYAVAIRRGVLTVQIEDGDFNITLDKLSIMEVIS